MTIGNHGVTWLTGAVCFSAILLVDARPAHAQWRCSSPPGDLSVCQESLVNDIEDAVTARWPAALTVAMRPISYVCTDAGTGPNGHVRATGAVAWSVELQGGLRSFLLGRFTAAADIGGALRASGTDMATTTWPDTASNYVFAGGTSEVIAPEGSTGVRELGAVAFTTPAGAFWTGTLPLYIRVPGDRLDCTFREINGARSITKTGTSVFRVDFPVAWTAVREDIGEAIRAQFRHAVRQVVIGVP